MPMYILMRPGVGSVTMIEKAEEHTELESENSDDVIVALRTAQQHQVQLNLLADQKANINIGFTLFFITLSQSQLSLIEDEQQFFRFGFMLLILSIATSLLLAMVVVLPRTGKTKIQKPEQMSNPFYFGMFSQLKQDDYVSYLSERLYDNAAAQRMLATDIYQIGTVLKRKYRLLRFSYGFLALAIVIAVILFIFKILIA